MSLDSSLKLVNINTIICQWPSSLCVITFIISVHIQTGIWVTINIAPKLSSSEITILAKILFTLNKIIRYTISNNLRNNSIWSRTHVSCFWITISSKVLIARQWIIWETIRSFLLGFDYAWWNFNVIQSIIPSLDKTKAICSINWWAGGKS